MQDEAFNIELDGIDSSTQAMIDLLAATRRTIHWYTPTIEPRFYNGEAVLDALRSLIVGQPRVRCYMVLPSALEWRQSCPLLQSLTERLSSAIQVRSLAANEPRERPEFGWGFVIADERLLLLHNDPRRLSGRFTDQDAARASLLLSFFQEIWEKSAPDQELRRLGI